MVLIDLSGPGRPEERDDLPLFHLKIDVLKDAQVLAAPHGIGLKDILCLKDDSHQSSLYFSCAKTNNLFQRSLLMLTTESAMTMVLAKSILKSPQAVAMLMEDPRPGVVIVFPAKVKYSETIMAFHAPPVAVVRA